MPRASLTSTTSRPTISAWQVVGQGFASFVGKNKCVALKAHETRFTVPVSSLPGALLGALLYQGFEFWRHALRSVVGRQETSVGRCRGFCLHRLRIVAFPLRSLQDQGLPFPGSAAQAARRP